MTRLGLICATLIGLLTALPALAQDAPTQPAILVADDVFLDGNDQLVATGNVEAIYEGRRLQARQITYDKTGDRLIVTGPIVLHEANNTLILADAGEIDRDMENGILRGARVVMDTHVQLAAREMARVSGRYNQLVKVSVTSCRICEDGQPPLWQIRARRVIHDQEEQQLYFEDAQFRVLDTPLFYLPRLRLPDPTLERATGFLVPTLKNSSLLGFGAKVPYFIRLGDHRDLTLTPFLTNETRTLEMRYRQTFRNGRIEVNAAASDDDFSAQGQRAYLFATGGFALANDFDLTFDIESVTDSTYLLDYDYAEKDRLDSEIALERTTRDKYFRAALTYHHSLRVGEQNSTLPKLALNGQYERRFYPSRLGGELRLTTESHGHYRSSDLVSDGLDLDIWADGRDVARLSAGLAWHRNWTGPGGILVHFETGAVLDTFQINQSGGLSASSATEITPSVAVELRWPLLKSIPNGVAHVLEPVVQLAWVGGSNPNIPNDESTRVEFDEGNLFNVSRYPAPDRRERGVMGAYGINWTRYTSSGWKTALAFGQVVRANRQLEVNGIPSFTHSSGLRDKFSDVLVAAQLKTPNGLVLTARSLFDDAFKTTKAEARGSWHNDLANIGATYIWLRSDLRELRPGTISEWAFDATYRLSQHWTGSADWRYDVARDDNVSAGIGLIYTNECVDIELSASRRFTSSINLAPSTDISFTVGLRGFTTKTSDKSYTRTCRK